jgi:hypothetical protein
VTIRLCGFEHVTVRSHAHLHHLLTAPRDASMNESFARKGKRSTAHAFAFAKTNRSAAIRRLQTPQLRPDHAC